MIDFIPVILTHLSAFLLFSGSLVSRYHVLDPQPSLRDQAFSPWPNSTLCHRVDTTETGQQFLSDPFAINIKKCDLLQKQKQKLQSQLTQT
jgi:hypothetical protein